MFSYVEIWITRKIEGHETFDKDSKLCRNLYINNHKNWADLNSRTDPGVYCDFQQYFSYIVQVSFIDGGNQNTLRKSLTCRKSLANLIT